MGSQPDSPSSEDSGDETPGLDLPLSPGMENLTPEDVPGVVGVSQTNPYGCQFCDKAFPRLSFLKIHEQVHSKKWKKVMSNVCILVLPGTCIYYRSTFNFMVNTVMYLAMKKWLHRMIHSTLTKLIKIPLCST